MQDGVFPLARLRNVRAELQPLRAARRRHLLREVAVRALVHRVAERVGAVPQAEAGMVLEERHHVLRAAGVEESRERGRVELLSPEEVDEVVALEVRPPVLLVVLLHAVERVPLRVVHPAAQLVPVRVQARALDVRAPRGERPEPPVDEDAELRVHEPFRARVGVHRRARRLVLPGGVHGVHLRHLLLRARHRLRRMVLGNLAKALREEHRLPVLGPPVPFRCLRHVHRFLLPSPRQLVRPSARRTSCPSTISPAPRK